MKRIGMRRYVFHLWLSHQSEDDLYNRITKDGDKIEELTVLYESEREVKEDYKSKVNKAIEYIEKKWYSKNTRNIDELYSLGNWKLDLLEILKGEQK